MTAQELREPGGTGGRRPDGRISADAGRVQDGGDGGRGGLGGGARGRGPDAGAVQAQARPGVQVGIDGDAGAICCRTLRMSVVASL